MNIGATVQEVQESKKIDPKDPNRRYPSRRETKKTIYYYQSSGPLSTTSLLPEDIYVPIENYSALLIRHLDLYLNKISRSLDVDTIDVLVTLRSVVFPNEKEFQIANPTKSVAVWEMVQKYTKCIMQLIGSLAECVLVDSCANNAEINKTCMNIALFKDEILEGTALF